MNRLSTVARQHYLPPDLLCPKEELRSLAMFDYNDPIIAANSPKLMVLEDWRAKRMVYSSFLSFFLPPIVQTMI
jgi:hypothetical protein